MDAPLLGRPTPAPPASALPGWLLAAGLTVAALALLAPIAGGLVLVTAFAATVVEEPLWRLAVGAAVCLVVPALARWRLAELLARTRFPAPSFGAIAALGNLALGALLAFGFADDTGRTLRRHGDWFVGERNGFVARLFRHGLGAAAGYLERFDPPPELAPLVLPPDPHNPPVGPFRPGIDPPTSPERVVQWFHPLAGPRRALPMSESRRFGAPRPQPRPVECELGHCGVDLGSTVGEAVLASFDGVVEKIERDGERGGRAGRYVRLGHKGGAVVTRYIHLDSIRADLKEGDTVRGGELIGRLGATGTHNSGPHLHFAVSLRPGGPSGSERYVDPEPLLRRWELVDPEVALKDGRASR